MNIRVSMFLNIIDGKIIIYELLYKSRNLNQIIFYVKLNIFANTVDERLH